MANTTVALICGGQSLEHKISLLSAYNIHQQLDRDRYDVLLLGITEEGQFVCCEQLILHHDDPNKICLNPAAREVSIGKQMIDGRKIDVAYPIIHGTSGEDGNLQGFLNMLQIPFVGAGTKSSALAMDKHWTKLIVASEGIKSAKFIVYRQPEPMLDYQQLSEKLGPIIFVKPASLGSSVGTFKCDDQKSLQQAIEEAIKHDDKLLIEECIDGRELEIGVLGTYQNMMISVPSEIKTSHEFYSYEAKYIDKHGTETVIPAELSEQQTQELKSLAGRIYRLLECQGMARVDFFLSKQGFIFNEINTLPGFTSISMYPQMFAKSGISYKQLLNRLIEIALI